jgi:hypothetical protein
METNPMRYDTVRVLVTDRVARITTHPGVTICQWCDEMARPAITLEVTGMIQVASVDASREPMFISATLCASCLDARFLKSDLAQSTHIIRCDAEA